MAHLSPPPPVDAAALGAAFERARDALSADALLADDPRVGFSAAELERRLVGAASVEALWSRLASGPDQYRYAGLRVLQEAFSGRGASTTIAGPLRLEPSFTWVVGDLRVGGDLIVPDDASLVVLGRLCVEGQLVAGFWSSAVAAQRIELVSGISGGEVLATEAIVAADRLYLCNNEHSCRSPLVEARVLVDFERSNAFGRVVATQHVTRWDFAAAAAALGLPPDHEGDLMSAFRRQLQP